MELSIEGSLRKPSLMERFESTSEEWFYYKNKATVLSKLIEIAKSLNSTNELSQLLRFIIESSQKVMHADASSLMLLDERTNELVFEVALGKAGGTIKKTMVRMPVGEGIAGIVAQTGEPLKIDDVYTHPGFNPNYDKETGYRTKSMLCVPLKAKEKLIGVAQVINKLDEEGNIINTGFTDEDLETFKTFCSLAAVAIDNINMHKECLEKEKLEKELELARVIQESFLIRDFSVSIPLVISAKNITAQELGGDLYDVFTLPDGRIGVLIGDVSGKGITAALYMARFISEFRFLAELEHDPTAVFKKSNNILTDRAARGMFITLLYMSFSPDRRELTWVSAGHLPLILVRKKDNAKREVIICEDGEEGPPLGILKNIEYKGKKAKIESGDTYLLYTDGVIEARDEHKNEYGMKRLIGFLEKCSLNSESLLDDIISDIQKFKGNASQHDDLTMVLVRAK